MRAIWPLLTFLLLPVCFANATIIGGVDFPEGEISFADSIFAYAPDAGGNIPSAPNSAPNNALGIPDAPAGIGACSGLPEDCPFVSLGDGGLLIIEFVDNFLTGSDNADDDLWIFEVGPDVEDTFVAISTNGTDWLDVGKVFGSKSGVDIDAFGYGSSDQFRFVRLIDDSTEGAQSGASVGADIDAVGAISTVRVAVGEPAGYAMCFIGLVLLIITRQRAGL